MEKITNEKKEIKMNQEQPKEFIFTPQEIDKLFAYLAKQPWAEVNELMGILYSKVNNPVK
jgi:hypothetical protein